MKLIKSQKKTSKIDIITSYITQIEQYIVFIYLFCMLGIFPLLYKEQYHKIGNTKFEFFWNVSLFFIILSAIFILFKAVIKKITISSFINKLSFLDFTVFIYGVCVCLSYGFSDFKEYAFKGAAGWEMGLCSQLIFVAIYFLVSKQKESLKFILGIHLSSSFLVFVFGILHRFEIDPLGMYEGLNLQQKVEFLSTIGQATWFSSYVCTTFAVGLVLFYISKKHSLRIISGIYSVISFGILVTQNSDSAFIAIAGILLLLGYFSLSDIEKWCRFWQVSSLMWGTFAGIGILQRIFVDRAVPLDALSIFFSQSVFTWVMLIVSFMIMLFYSNLYKKNLTENQLKNAKNRTENIIRLGGVMSTTKAIYKGIVFFLVVGILLTLVFIYLNTKGYLLQWFNYQNTHPYLLFDYHWGSNRGSTWMISWQAFMQLPFYQKLFGVGPDSLSAYLYSIPEISDLLHSLWGNVRLTNAHNEYLNSLLCYGVVGVSAWLAVLIGGITYFYKKAKDNPFMIAFALCIMGYACHNIFCYQQVCATPFLFIALGIGESLTKSENFNTIK